jgi:hypothetical protein
MIRWMRDLADSFLTDACRKAPSRQADSDEVTGFPKRHRALDTYLRNRQAASGEIPPDLHSGIMRSVRLAASRDRQLDRGPRPATMRLAMASLAVALAAGFTVFWTRPPSRPPVGGLNPESMNLPSPHALAERAATSLPKGVVSPLQDEWERLRQDALATADFLVASLPSSPTPERP